MSRRWSSVTAESERGSIVPLILGFFLIAFLVVGGAVAASSAFTSVRDLQSVCDGAAIAAANSADLNIVRGGAVTGSLPLGSIDSAVHEYLAEDPTRSDVNAVASLTDGGTTVRMDCSRRTTVALASTVGLGKGVMERVSSSAQSPVG